MFTKMYQYFQYLLGFISMAISIILMYLFRSWNRAIRKGWAHYQVGIIGGKIERLNGEQDPEVKLFILNHRSMLDIIAMETVMQGDTCWIGKREITNIPFFGHLMKAPRMITIDREDKKGIITLLKESKNRLAAGRIIMVFPEGTRSKGDKMLKFKPGAKIIAEKLKLKVQPIVLYGTDAILDSQNGAVKSGTLYVEFLESFTPVAGTEWLNDTREKMQVTYDRIASEKGIQKV